MNENDIRAEMAQLSKSLYERGLTSGASGNISVKLDDGWLMSPTGVPMGELDPSWISKLDLEGEHVSGDKPTKEAFLHMAMYEKRPKAGAVVHLHSSYSVAVSCLEEIDHNNVLPPLTAYYAMRIGTLPLVPYYPPGDVRLADAVSELAADHHAVLLANHGPVVAGKSLHDAIYASEELEETAKLFLLLHGHRTSPLTAEQVRELNKLFPKEI